MAEGKLWSVLVLVADGVVIEIDGEAEEFGAVGDISKRTSELEKESLREVERRREGMATDASFPAVERAVGGGESEC